MINVHHYADLVIDFINENDWDGLSIEISDERNQLLDTGGAIKNAEWFFEGEENILIHNVDVITEVDFTELEKHHISKGSMISLCVRERHSTRGLLFDKDNKLCGWTNKTTSQFKWVNNEVENHYQKAYSGVYLASSDFAKKTPFFGSVFHNRCMVKNG